jgi:hypothetical protein
MPETSPAPALRLLGIAVPALSLCGEIPAGGDAGRLAWAGS